MRMKFDIEKRVMLILRQITKQLPRIAKARKNPNAQKKGKLEVLWNFGSGYHQTRVDIGKIRKEYHR